MSTGLPTKQQEQLSATQLKGMTQQVLAGQLTLEVGLELRHGLVAGLWLRHGLGRGLRHELELRHGLELWELAGSWHMELPSTKAFQTYFCQIQK